jgi:diguanylate cyclase
MSTARSSPPTSGTKAAPWQRTLLGASEPMQQAITRLLWQLPAYLLAAIALLVALPLQHLPPASVSLVLGYMLLGLMVFYGLLRGGQVTAAGPATLAFPQVLFSISAILLACATMASTRVLAMQCLCLILVLNMPRLSKLQARSAMLVAILGLALLLGQDVLSQPAQFNAMGGLINVIMASVTLTVLMAVAGLARRLSTQDEQQHIEMAEALSQLQSLAIRDGLTRAYTRGHMLMLLELEAARQKRTHRPFCVAMLDIDFFKKVNDRFGHAVGDAVLIDFAKIAQSALDSTHSLARWGGEEFLALMPESTMEEAMATLEKMRELVHAHDWAQHAEGLAVTFSGGVCLHASGAGLLQSIEQADTALYAAKHAGRDRVLADASVVS